MISPCLPSRLVGMFLALLACGPMGCGAAMDVPQPSDNFPDTPRQILIAPDTKSHVEIRTSPYPPVKGNNWIQYRISDAAGTAVTGLPLDVLPWMPAHGHGTSVQPRIEDQGAGFYLCRDVFFYMAGHWELRSTLGPGGADAIVPTFDVD